MVLKSREKILIILAVVAIAFWVFATFYYTPQNRKIKALKVELKAADLRLDESLLMTKGVETLEAEVLRQEEALKRLSERTLRGRRIQNVFEALSQRERLSSDEGRLPDPPGRKSSSSRGEEGRSHFSIQEGCCSGGSTLNVCETKNLLKGD